MFIYVITNSRSQQARVLSLLQPLGVLDKKCIRVISTVDHAVDEGDEVHLGAIWRRVEDMKTLNAQSVRGLKVKH